MIKDLSIISIEDGLLLGLRFRAEDKLTITSIIGSEALDATGTIVVQGFEPGDMMTRLASSERPSDQARTREREIHMLTGDGWVSEQTRDILLHQNRAGLRYNMVSPLAALAALQYELGVGITYLSKQREIFLDQGSIDVRTFNAQSFPGSLRPGYLCGPGATHALQSNGSLELLSFEAMRVELRNALRSELQGLGHLFALTVGAALHLVDLKPLHNTPDNS